MPKARPCTVQIRLTPELKRVVDGEMTRLKSLGAKVHITREHAIVSLIRRHAHNLQPDEVKHLYEGFREEAVRLKLCGNGQLELGKIGPARQTFLRAAAFELLALASIENPSDMAIIQHLAEVVQLAKIGTGYKALPDAKPSTRLMSSVGNA